MKFYHLSILFIFSVVYNFSVNKKIYRKIIEVEHNISTSKKRNSESDKINFGCKFSDIFLLAENEKILTSFITQSKKWNILKEKSNYNIFVPLNKLLIKDFINSIKNSKSKNDSNFSKTYEFRAFPKQYKTKRNCKDEIRLFYDKINCIYEISIQNCFYVKDFGCSEHDLIYTFKINKGQVKFIEITGAG